LIRLGIPDKVVVADGVSTVTRASAGGKSGIGVDAIEARLNHASTRTAIATDSIAIVALVGICQ
jgi:hypothetical protein